MSCMRRPPLAMLTVTMKILFAMSIGCFFAVLWVILSIARRLRTNRTASNQSAIRPALQEFFEAGEYRTPRSLKLVQNRSRVPLAEVPFDQKVHSPVVERVRPFASASVTPISLFGVKMGSAPPESQPAPALEATDAFSAAMKPRLASIHRFPDAGTTRPSPEAASIVRKSPQSDRSGEVRRLDLSHYGEQMGDLTDPYTRGLTASGIRGKWNRGI